MPSPVLVVAGTRPEVIKLSPIIKQSGRLKTGMIFVWSGQHYDYEMSEVFFEGLEIPKPEINLGIKSGSHSTQTAKAMVRLEKVISRFKPSLVLAEGDTNTVVAAALTAIKAHVPFAHVEAGLRSYDRTMPEEVNRIVADSCSELLFAPTQLAVSNLTHEGTPLRKIHLTGNTVVDTVIEHKNRAGEKGAELLKRFNVSSKDYLLITLHRQENTDNPSNLKNIVKALLSLNKKFKIIFPAHPRTEAKLEKMGLLKTLKKNTRMVLIPPQGYLEFLGLLSHCLAVLTDSGGVQEEALTLGIPTVTLRCNTERPETVLYGINVLAGTEPEAIIKLTETQVEKSDEIRKRLKTKRNPFGAGDAGKKIISRIKDALENGIKVESSDTRNDPYIVYGLGESRQLKTIDDRFEIMGIYNQSGLSTIVSTHNDAAAAKCRVLVRGPLIEMAKILKK